jgi:hypothetical protein
VTTEISDLDLKEAGAQLAAESARFASFGWMRGTSGNLSVVVGRDPLRLAVTASGHDKGELTPPTWCWWTGMVPPSGVVSRLPRPNCTLVSPR